jgi:hypothetical protein
MASEAGADVTFPERVWWFVGWWVKEKKARKLK